MLIYYTYGNKKQDDDKVSSVVTKEEGGEEDEATAANRSFATEATGTVKIATSGVSSGVLKLVNHDGSGFPELNIYDGSDTPYITEIKRSTATLLAPVLDEVQTTANVATTLSSSIDNSSGTTAIPVVNPSDFTNGHTILIGTEQMTYTGVTATIQKNRFWGVWEVFPVVIKAPVVANALSVSCPRSG